MANFFSRFSKDKEESGEQPGKQRPHAAADRQADLLAMQNSAGNQAVTQLVQSQVSEPDDAFEKEADRVARQITDEDTGLQPGKTAASRSTAPDPPSPQIKDGGQPLPETERVFFESKFGRDFSDVRIHTGAEAAKTAQNLEANAFTTGHDITFAAGQYQPGTTAGQQLLAHELTHVAQRDGDSARTQPGGVSLSAPAPAAGVIARAVSSQYGTIRSNLTYGLFDWAITDKEAGEVLSILAGLSPADFADTMRKMESEGLVSRLMENVSEADRTKFAALITKIQSQRSTSVIAAHINDLMSYGLLDWVITDAEARLVLLTLKALPKNKLRDLLVIISDKQYERFFANLSAKDRADNLQFLQEVEMIRSSGMTLAQLSQVQKTHLQAQATAAGVSIGTHIRGHTTATGYGGYTATWWPSLTAAEQQKWRDRFKEVIKRIRANAPKDVVQIIDKAAAAGGGIFFKPKEVEELGPNILAYRQGNILGVGKLWLETAENNPADVFENIVHELGGHLEYGDTMSWTIMKGTLAALPPGERAIATSGPRSLFSAYGYMETEMYAELRELPYRTSGSAGDEPATDLARQLQKIKDAFAPQVAEAIVRGFRRRIQVDSRITPAARKLYDEKVKDVFGFTF